MVGLTRNDSHENTQMLTIKATDARRDGFFKRSFNVFKKISELWTLCALENVLVILSVGGKPFYIGKPGVYNSVYKFPNYTIPDCDQINIVDIEEEEYLLRCISEVEDKLQKLKVKNSLMEKLMKVTTVNQKLDQEYVSKLVNVLNAEEFLALETLITSRIDECDKKMKEYMNKQEAVVDASTSASNGENNASFDGSSENDSSTNVDEH
ncbi:hypothetical protein HRI_004058100 [Hibiscus trionum]|uniref:MADS-box domain-containing protein n=1 Tax=Hibiscus trionum TaxID=183268 RepID=A0A9W7IZ22_HIBTR|nr:hypothetical protein HRI_004058100 [Hibiscus trionum]